MTGQEQHQLQILATAGAPEWARVRAERALEIIAARQREEISDSEMAELMEDLVRSDRLDAEADNIEIKTALVMAVYGAANLV